MKIKRLAEDMTEWATDVVLQVGTKYILRHENGGTRGSHQRGNRFPALLDADEPLTPEEAAAKCLAFGADESVIAGIASGLSDPAADLAVLREALRDCITEEGAVAWRSAQFAGQRLEAISNIARAALARTDRRPA